jgi:peptidoglycan/LPS O-acetylase OafA/YrhL
MNPSPNTPPGPAAKTSLSQGRIIELDGLRGMAILFVLLFHYVADQGVWMDAAPGPGQGTLLFHFQRLFVMGWAGVDLFFVLSGFLIGGILLDARTSPQYFGTFYVRRFCRIIPLYYLWVGVYFLLIFTPFRGLLRSLPESLSSNPEKWSAAPIYFLFLQNSVKILHGNFGTAWLGQLWSLAVEEQFYLLMPLAVRFLPQRRLVPLLCLAVVGAPMARLVVSHLVPQHPAAAYVLTPCRVDALAMGVILAVGWRKQEWKVRFLRHRLLAITVCSLLLIAVAFLAFWRPSQYSKAIGTWGFSCIDALCAFLLAIAIMFPNGLWASVCRWPFLLELGRISYCLYVIHQAVNLMCHEFLLGASPRFMDWRSIGVTILAAALAYGLARLSWIFFEHPLLRRGHAYQYFPRRPVSPAGSEHDPILRTSV